MKAYIVEYKGLWLGGTAAVIADSLEQAVELVRVHKDTLSFVKISVSDPISIDSPTVLYNNNGDY